MTLQHDAKMDYYVVECHKAYQSYNAFESAANPFMNRMILKHKGGIK
jgi:hypothetical protein